MFNLSGVGRAGATRSGYYSTKTFISVAGTHYGDGFASATQRVLLESLEVTDVLNESPNTCHFTCKGFLPTARQEIIITQGSKNTLERLFAGHVVSATARYVGQNPQAVLYDVNCIDYTWQLNQFLVTKRYTNQSATAIAQAIISTFTTGFTTVNVVAGLDVVDEITFTNVPVMDAIAQLAKRVGGYCFVDYRKDVHVFLTDASVTNPRDLTSTHPSLLAFDVERAAGEQITRVRLEGGGVNALTDVPAGETILPVDDAAWYEATGGTVLSGPQRITYTGVQDGSGGGLVGPGASPSSAPVATLVAAAGIESGIHSYAVAFTTSLPGESLPGPLATVTHGNVSAAVTNPSTAPTLTEVAGAAFWAAGDHVQVAVSYVTAAGETRCGSTGVVVIVGPSGSDQINVSAIPLGPSSVLMRNLYRVQVVGSTPTGNIYVTTLADNSSTTYTNLPTGSLYSSSGQLGPTSNTAGNYDTAYNQTALTGIPVGGASVLTRKIYRTVAGGSTLKLQQTIADNVTTSGVTDSTADASLGATAQVVDGSGLAQPDGQINASSTSMLVAGLGAFASGGGWAAIEGRQTIRYTSKSATALLGIPAAGSGAIVSTVSYNSSIVPCAALTGIPASGVGAIVYALKQGDEVNLEVEVNDTVQQTAIAAAWGGDGVIVATLQDRRLSHTEALARATAYLQLKSEARTGIRFRTLDLNTRSGRTIVVNLPAPISVTGTYLIQEVTVSNFVPGQRPVFTASASTERFSFEDLLRQTRDGA